MTGALEIYTKIQWRIQDLTLGGRGLCQRGGGRKSSESVVG